MGVGDSEGSMDTSEFTDEQIEALQALADGYNDQSVSRRDVMKLVGAGGVGALLGGGGAASAVGQASAGTAQSGQLGTAADPVDIEAEDVNATSVNTDEQYSDSGVLEQRLNAMYEANRIRTSAGIPANEVVGIRSGKSAGLSDSGVLTSSSTIDITSESDASSVADSGSGTESDPYIIRDREIDASGSATAIYLHDSVQDYYIDFINIKAYNGTSDTITVNDGSTKTEYNTFKNCVIYNNESYYAVKTVADAGFEECHFSGADRYFHTGGQDADIRVRDSLVSTQDYTGTTPTSGLYMGNGSAYDLQYVEFEGDHDPVIHLQDVGSASIKNSEFRGTYTLAVDGTIIDELNDVSIHACNFVGSADSGHINVSNVVSLESPSSYDRGNLALEISGSYFGDTPDGSGLVLLSDDNNSYGVRDARVHHCKFNKPTGGIMSPGNECLETFSHGERVEFDHCWAVDCVEDAFEHSYPVGQVQIHHCVGDNIQGQIVDYFGSATEQGGATTTGGQINGDVHHIYGSCRDVGVILTDVSDIRVDGHIHIEHYDGRGEPAILIEQRNDSSGGSPNNITIKGPLPLAENIDGELVDTAGTVGTNNWAIWMDENQIQTWDPDNVLGADWTAIR